MTPDEVCASYAGRNVKITSRALDHSVLLEGDREALEFLGNLLLAQANDERSCKKSIEPNGAGSALFNPVIRGWANYYSTVVSKQTFARIGYTLFLMLWAWAKCRHPTKGKKWSYGRYWRKNSGKVKVFQPPAGQPQLRQHVSTPIRRHVKVQAKRSPYDGDWLYWSTRRGGSPDVSPRVAKLLKKKGGRCIECGLFFRDGDTLEVDYVNPQARIGKEAYYNLMLVHRYCLQQREAELSGPAGTHDKRQEFEEPYDGKLSRTVLKPSGGGDPVA